MEAQLSKLTESLNQMNEIQRDNSDNSRKLFRLLDNLETSFLNMEIGGLEETGFGKAYEPVQKDLLEGIERGVQGMKKNLIDRAKDALYEFGIVGKFRNAQRKRAQDSAKAEAQMKGDIFSSLRVALRSETVMENISETMDKMYKIAKQEQEANAIQRGFSLESSREEGRGGGDDGKEDMLAHRKEKGGLFSKLGKIFSKYARLIEVAAIGIGIALLAFFNSDTFKKIKKVFIEDIWPATKTLFNDFLVPVAGFLWDSIVSTWDAIMKLFSGLSESFDLFGKGDWWGGITKFFGSIGEFLLDLLDAQATMLWNTMSTIFGFETTDSVGGSIKQFFSDLWLTLKFKVMWMWEELKKTITETWDSIKNTLTAPWTWYKNKVTESWTSISTTITELWDSITTTITETWTSIKTTITELWPKIKNKVTEVFDDLWFAVHGVLGDFSFFKFLEETFGDLFTTIKAIFGGDFSMETLWIGGKALLDLVTYPLNLAANFIKDIFKWGDPEKPFKLSDFLFGPEGVVTKVISWFKGLFGMGGDGESKSLTEMFTSMIPDFELPSWDTIKGKIGVIINDLAQGLAEMLDIRVIPDKVINGIVNLGNDIAKGLGATSYSRYSTKTDKLETVQNPNRPPGAALQGEAGGGLGGDLGAVNANVVAPQTSNSSVEQKFSTPPSPQNPAAARNASLARGGLWG